MFRVNDLVLYGSDGICRITEITKRLFREKTVEYYVLKPVYNKNATLFVPTENEQLTAKMRPALTKEEIRTIIQDMPESEIVWIEDEAERKLRYREILSSGNSHELVKLIKTLYIRQQQQKAIGKKLHMADERFFREAEKLLYNEFAVVLDIPQEEVLPYIRQLIDGDL